GGPSVPPDTGGALHAFAEQQGTPFERIASLGLVAPLTVGASPTVWVSAEHGTTVEYLVHLRALTIDDWDWTLWFDGNDVTSSAKATESVIWDDTTEGGFTHDRLVKVAVDLDSIGFGTVGDTLTMEVAATQGTQVVTAFSAAAVETSEIDEDALIERVKPGVERFLLAAGASESGGKVTFATPAADLEDAVRALGECLAATGLVGGKSVSFTSNAGYSVIVGHKSVDGAADVAIAFGGANDHGNGEDAKATNDNPGGAAVAVGGDGEDDTPAGGTGGGGATAETSGGGHAVAVGGNGGQNGQKGGNGGDATAKPNAPGPGAAFGGDGGNPGGSDEPGGGGGDAKLGDLPLEGGDGGTGKHGTGGWVWSDSSGGGSHQTGQTKDNTGT
ncbi:MAG: hypothetical protein ACF8XB_23530, partial [Planctomycetota bacterium JB042]